MTTSGATIKKPLWLLIEEKILELDSKDLSEASIQRIAGELDNTGYNVSHHGGNMMQLRWAIDDMREAGRPLMKDFNSAIAALTLDDVADPYLATENIISNIGETWSKLKKSDCRPEVIRIVEETKLDLLIAKAKGLPEDEGIRFLIEEQISPDVLTTALDVTKEKYEQVNTDMENELAERARVASLLEGVEGKTDEERVKHLFENNVSESLIIEMAKVDQSVIDGVKQAMEAELKEKQKLEEEEAARKKEAAAGPPLEEIPPAEMLDHIYAIREIMEFSDQEDEIRTMCDQSSIPQKPCGHCCFRA
jgi:hypothetical protein